MPRFTSLSNPRLLGSALVLALSAPALAQTTAFTFQGQLKNNGLAATANYDFQFSLYSTQAPGGALIAGPVPANNIPATVGLFTVQIDFGISPFAGSDRFLEIAVRPAGGGGFTTLTTRAQLTPSPYSLFSKTGSATQLQTRAVNAVAPAAGQVLKWSGADWAPAADSSNTYVAGAGLNLVGNTFSIANNGVTNAMLASDLLSLNKVSGGTMSAASGFVGVGRSTTVTGAEVFGLQSNVTTAGNFGGMYAQTQGTLTRPFYGYSVGNGTTTAYHYLDGNDSNTWKLYNGGIYLTVDRAGLVSMNNLAVNSATDTAIVVGTGTGPVMTAGHDNVVAKRMWIGHSEAFPNWGIQYRDLTSDGISGDSVEFCAGNQARPSFGVVLGAREFRAYDTSGVETISLNASTGTTTTKVLTITGADVAEKFPVTDKVEPGMVVEIDPEHAGMLRVCREAYCRRVAGIASGAGDLQAGAILGNMKGSEASPPIALSGRVWCLGDASSGAIELGDLLTTSDVPGHAMKASDTGRAAGAMIGKAMTKLAAGEKGLVLVLVNLQ